MTTTLDQREQQLLADIDRTLAIVRRAWNQGQLYNPMDGSCCLAGALHCAVLDVIPEPGQARRFVLDADQLDRYRRAMNHIERYLVAHDLIAEHGDCKDDPIGWNDDPDRTKDDVEQVLTEIIELLRD